MSRLPLAVALVWLGGCIDTSTVLEDDEPLASRDPAGLASRAREEFRAEPRSAAGVAEAFELMRQAARTTAIDDPERLPRLAAAARYAVWVAQHGENAEARSAHADAAIVVGNTAVRDAPERVEGYYYRAIATGLFARENELYGLDAMSQIRADARRAIEIDPTFDAAGPHRVLGGLYLNAPGPPTGVGSVLRAIAELEAAVKIAPDHPGNLLFLAGAYREAGREPEQVAAIVDRLPAAIEGAGDRSDRVLWRRQLSELRDGAPRDSRCP